MDKLAYAKRLLSHYINVASQTDNGIPGWDCQAEIESIVDMIVEAAVEKALEEIDKRHPVFMMPQGGE